MPCKSERSGNAPWKQFPTLPPPHSRNDDELLLVTLLLYDALSRLSEPTQRRGGS